MAIALECVNVVVRISAIESRFQGGISAYRAFVDNGSYFQDLQLARAGFMSTMGADRFADSLLQRGLRSDDIAIVTSSSESESSINWLTIGTHENTSACWLTDSEPGELLYWRRPLVILCPCEVYNSLPELLSEVDATCNSLPPLESLKGMTQFTIQKLEVVLYLDAIFVDNQTGVGLLITSDFGRIAGAPDDSHFLRDLETLLTDAGATKRE